MIQAYRTVFPSSLTGHNYGEEIGGIRNVERIQCVVQNY